MQLTLTEDCGECVGCRIRAEVVGALTYIDEKMIPPYVRALEELRAEERGSHRYRVLDALSRSARRRKNEWMLARERFVTPQVTFWCMCQRQPQSGIYADAGAEQQQPAAG